MIPLLAGLIVVSVMDQAVKASVHRLGSRSIRLGSLGQIRVVHSRMWMMRSARGASLSRMWVWWLAGAVSVVVVCTLVPSASLSGGAILGASLSHAVETSRRGVVCDYICCPRWPAFNLADIALTVGGSALTIELIRALY